MSEKNVDNKKADIEQLLREGKTIQISPKGMSMYPMFLSPRDQAVIEPAVPEKLKKGDVVLYRRDGGILVLHRICRKSGEGYYMAGDNQSELEGPLRPDQIKGRLAAFIRKGRKISVRNPIYRAAAMCWVWLLPRRGAIHAALAKLRKLFKKSGKK